MAFAILWLVTGDLITYHQQAIFGVDYYGHESPFQLPKDKQANKTIKIKSGSDNDFSKQFVPKALAQSNLFLFSAGSPQKMQYFEIIAFHLDLKSEQSKDLRAPPQV